MLLLIVALALAAPQQPHTSADDADGQTKRGRPAQRRKEQRPEPPPQKQRAGGKASGKERERSFNLSKAARQEAQKTSLAQTVGVVALIFVFWLGVFGFIYWAAQE